MMLKQLNLNKCKVAMQNLRHMLLNESPSIYCIQEPYCTNLGFPANVSKNYNAFGVTNSRAIILAHVSIDLIFSNEFSTEDITVCFMNSSKRYIASIYLDILKDPIHPLMIKMAEYFATSKKNAIWCMDSNAHSSALWNSSDTNNRGEILEFFIMSHCAHVLNEGSVATFSNSRSSTIIDITLAFGEHEDIVDWKVDTNCFTFSDHKLITMKLGESPPKKLWPKIDWAKFEETIKFKPVSYSLWDKNTIEIESEKIENIICDKIKDCTKYHQAKSFKDVWWSDELHKEKHKVKTLFHIRMRNPSADNIEKYVSARKSFSRNIRRAKKSSWIQFCESIDSPKNMSKLDKIIRNSRRQNIGLLEISDGVYARSVKETIEQLMTTHLPGCTTPTKVRPSSVEEKSQTGKIIYDLDFDSFINEEKVRLAIQSLSPLKAAGRDGIKAKALQLLGDDGIKRITNLYKAIVEIGYTPKRWLICDLVFLPKPGKDDYKKAKSFRGISLMQTLLKGLERLILWELEETTLKEYPISRSQFGFKKGTSTEHALSSLVDEVESAILRGKIALGVFLDVEQAFDQINFSSCIKSLEERNFPAKILRWYKFYLENRYAETSLHGVKVLKKVSKGVQQGSLLSPLIWSVYFEKWLSLKMGPVSPKAFCDDGIMLLTGHDQHSMVDIMQQAIGKTMVFGVQEGLKFNPKKTQVMFFHRKNKFKQPKMLKMSGLEIPYSDSVKYLGVTLDTRLRFNKHIDIKLLKAKRHLMLLRNAISSTWGPFPRALWWGYNGIVLPSFLYGSIVFAQRCRTKTTRDKLGKLNRLISCCMLAMRRSTPTNGLEVILNLPPLDLKVEERALKTMLRVIPQATFKWNGLGNGEVGHLKWGATELKNLGIDPLFNDSCPATLNISRKFQVDLDSFKSGLPISDNYTKCYTDGSKQKNGKTGYGLAVTRGDHMIGSENAQVSTTNSVFQAEVYAIDKSCHLLRQLETKSVTIFSDSMSGLYALNAIQTRSKVVKNCLDSLNLLANSGCKIELKWVKGHANHTGNEIADFLAKTGTANELNKVELPPPKSTAMVKISNAMYKKWNQRWKSNPADFKATKIFFPELNRKRADALMKLDRYTLSNMIQIISGHNWLKYFEWKLDPKKDATCRFCQWEDETAWHLVGMCPVFWRARLDIFEVTHMEECPMWNVNQLLKFINKTKLLKLMNPESRIGV